ncbi:MAG TPA: patatin [Flavobacteriaceae bacterium]|nr:patatin [Flavobacteriaceae bacterium]
MRALVISGGGSKGAFAGGIAQYLLEEEKRSYDLFLGTSTGSLLISHLALNKIAEIKEIYTNVDQSSIFNINPFLIVNRKGVERIKINHLNVLKNFIRGSKTFGASYNLRKLIEDQISYPDFKILQKSQKEVLVCVSNITTNSVEYKKLKDCSYVDFLDWIWISCNYVPFMSLVTKNGCEYADGGLGCVIPIEKAITLGATHVDAILLDTEFQQTNRVHSRNPFDALSSIFGFIADRIESQNVHIGKLVAEDNHASIRMFYTPKVLTTNSLVFNKAHMEMWWQQGWEHARDQALTSS